MSMGNDFDAIVIGSGITGGLAAKELCERGLKTLVLERGPNLEHNGPHYTDSLMPWERVHFGAAPQWYLDRNPHLKEYFANPDTREWFVTNEVQSYSTAKDRPFNWIRTYNLGGRSMFWGRKVFRMSPDDFKSNKLDGNGVPWPIGYEDLIPWYERVERFIGVSGTTDDINSLPDSLVQPGFELTCAEMDFRDKIETGFPGRRVIISRVANLTAPTPDQMKLGRGRCQSRNLCRHGCAFGAYYSTQSAALPAAQNTGNLTVKTDSVVTRLLVDAANGSVTEVEVVDANTRQVRRFSSRIVFLNASAVGSAQILLNSANENSPRGLANQTDVVGRYLNDHCGGVRIRGSTTAHADRYYSGRRPTGFYVPRYRNLDGDIEVYRRGFGFQGTSAREDWRRGASRAGIGIATKNAMRNPGNWVLSLNMFGESLPRFENRMTLHPSRIDKWGMPLVHFDAGHGDNEERMKEQAAADGFAMLTAAGYTNIQIERTDEPLGNKIHEFGTIVMGSSPTTSALDPYNRAHTVPNLFVTDGACMPSAGCQNPSLTYMALTARAVDHAVGLLQEGRL